MSLVFGFAGRIAGPEKARGSYQSASRLSTRQMKG